MSLTLVAFAGNSLLCRLALAGHAADAASFTGIRLGSGALMLALLTFSRRREWRAHGSWGSALVLFAYAAPFSYAYLRIGAGVGALVLFAAVQATMIGWGIARGERPRAWVWIGLALALGGLVGLTAPGASAPDLAGVVTMAVAGVMWGIYSLRGRSPGGDPLVTNASNFARCLPLAAVL
ncbi:MAG TPA: EamA family transporter, partial [Roseiflexaceae bacterium]